MWEGGGGRLKRSPCTAGQRGLELVWNTWGRRSGDYIFLGSLHGEECFIFVYAVQCSAVQCIVVQCNSVKYSALCSAVQCSVDNVSASRKATRCSLTDVCQYKAVAQCSAMQCSAWQCTACSALH